MDDPGGSEAGVWEKAKATKDLTEPAVREYLRSTTIHGLREFTLPVPTGFKIVWALVVLTTLGFMMYQIGGIINEYKAGTIVTKLSTTSLNDTPPLLFCPPEGFDYWKAQTMGINEGILDYMRGFLIAAYNWDVVIGEYKSEQELALARMGYRQILNITNGTLSTLMKQVSINTDENNIGFNFHCSKCKVQPLSTVKSLATGICNFFEPAPFETSLGVLGKNPQIEINLDVSNFSGGSNSDKQIRNPNSAKIITPDFLSHYYPKEKEMSNLGFTFAFGDEAYQTVGSYSNGITLNVGRDYDIFLTTFVNQKIYGCNEGQTQPRDCRADCIKRSVAHCSNNTCHGYVGEAGDVPHKNYCNVYDSYWGIFNHTCALNHYQACVKQPCPIPCRSETHQTSIFPGLPNRKMTTRVIVRSMGANAVIVLQDVEKYTFVSFVSNFGGLIGLFCGGSIISLCHLFYYVVITFCETKAKSATIQTTSSVHS